MASPEKREFDKYLKFFTYKAVQVVVQSRQGRKISTKSNPRGNDWFNMAVVDDKQVSSEMKRSLEGRLPEPGRPVSVEILMDTMEGDSIVLEVWSIGLDHSRRDVSVSVAHLLYPRLSLMLKSLVVLSRTTPAYRLSRSPEDNLKFTFRLYASPPDLSTDGFKSVSCAKTSCPFGTISLSLLYLQSITLPDRPLPVDLSSVHHDILQSPHSLLTDDGASDSFSLPQHLPFTASHPHSSSSSSGRGHHLPDHTPFSSILPRSDGAEEYEREESHDTLTSSEGGGGGEGGGSPSLSSLPTADQEQDGYILVDLQHIKPTFATDSHMDELGQFLQKCRDVPQLDLLSADSNMDLQAAMKVIEEKTGSFDGHSQSVNLT